MSDGKETPFAGQGGVNPRREGDDTLIINNDELPAHRFVNSGTTRARHVDIHARGA